MTAEAPSATVRASIRVSIVGISRARAILACRREDILAGRTAGAAFIGAHQAVQSATTLASGKVLAPFMFGGGTGNKLFQGRWTPRLADGMFAGTPQARSKSASHRGLWKAGRARIGKF